ncbi:MAG: hypothetical protein K1V80_05370 [Muribaculaceae bacterium]
MPLFRAHTTGHALRYARAYRGYGVTDILNRMSYFGSVSQGLALNIIM